MPAWSIPPLFYEQWLCIGTCLLLLALTLFGPRLQRNVAPKPHPFFIRHMKAFRWGRDIFAVCFVVAMLGFVAWYSVPDFARLSAASDDVMRRMELQFAWATFRSAIMPATVWSCFMIGMLSVFQSNITRAKRGILLVLCVLPVVAIAPNLPLMSSEFGWRTIPIGLLGALPSWLVNGPAVFTGQPSMKFIWAVLRRLNWVAGDYADWW